MDNVSLRSLLSKIYVRSTSRASRCHKVQPQGNKEITDKFLKAPIAQDHRNNFVWLCKVHGSFYTMNPEDMTVGLAPHSDALQNHCDICGMEAFGVGVFNSYNIGLTASRLTSIMRNLSKLLVAFAKSIPEHGARYSTIQLNRCYAAVLHTDSNNCGHSWAIALGSFTGGELWLVNPGGKKGSLPMMCLWL